MNDILNELDRLDNLQNTCKYHITHADQMRLWEDKVAFTRSLLFMQDGWPTAFCIGGD